MLLCELIVRQTPQGFSLGQYIWSVTCFYPEINQTQQLGTITQVRTWKQNSNSKRHQRKNPTTNTMNVPLDLICNFHYYLSQYGKCYIHTYYAGTLKSISNLNVKGRRKIILKTYLQAVFFFIITWNGCKFYF